MKEEDEKSFEGLTQIPANECYSIQTQYCSICDIELNNPVYLSSVSNKVKHPLIGV